jgi:hypothetical protein
LHSFPGHCKERDHGCVFHAILWGDLGLRVREYHDGTNRSPGGLSRKTVGAASGLRHVAAMCALRNLTQAPVVPEIENVIKEDEPMAWEVAQVLRAKKAELEREMSQTNAMLRNADTGAS